MGKIGTVILFALMAVMGGASTLYVVFSIPYYLVKCSLVRRQEKAGKEA